MVSLFAKKKILILLALVFLGLSGTIAAVTFYGQNVGNFVVDLDDKLGKLGIALSDTPSFESPSNRLLGEVLGKAKPVGQHQIIPEYVTEHDGSFKSKSGDYIGYTFYLKNIGDETVAIDSSLKITGATRNVDAAVRIWVFDDEEDTIYKKEETILHEYPSYYYPTTNFQSPSVVFNTVYKEFVPNQIKKISIIIWVEGEDPDCTDVGDKPITGGTFKIGMSFQSYREAK